MTRPFVRDQTNLNWIDVFCKGGWKMQQPDGSYITMTAKNTKIRNADNTDWVNLVCPIPVPTDIAGGTLFENRLVDSSGYLWCAGFGAGVYPDKTDKSNTWRKVYYSATNLNYMKGVSKLVANSVAIIGRTPTYIFTEDNKIWYAGANQHGEAGNGTGSNSGVQASVLEITDVTTAWNTALGSIGNIARFSDQIIILNDGRPFVLGDNYMDYLPNSASSPNHRVRGKLGAAPNKSWTIGSQTDSFNANWTQAKYAGANLINVAQMAKIESFDGTIAITADGSILHSNVFDETQYNSSTVSTTPTDAMLDLVGGWTGTGTLVKMHPHGILEGSDGKLYTVGQKNATYGGGRNKLPQFFDSGINITNFSSPVKKIIGTGGGAITTAAGATLKMSIMILLEDGRLYAIGKNGGRFGNGNTTDFTSLTLINSDVSDFSSAAFATWLMKNDNSLWATGSNSYGMLGIGVADNVTPSVSTWTRCVITSD